MTAETRTARPRSLVLVGAAYVAAMAALAAWAAWPMYRSAALVLLAATATLAGLLIAGGTRRWAWRAWLTSAVTATTFLVLGVPLAVPSALTDSVGFLGGLRDLLLGVVTGWKDLVTVQLPIGSYRNLLVPALVVFLLGTVLAATLAWRSVRAASAAVLVALAMVMFGLAFGATTVSEPWHVGPLTLTAPRESLIGVLAFFLSLGFVAWRAADARTGALRRAADRSGAQLAGRAGTNARRGALAGAMVVVAVGVALAVPVLGAASPRDVLRSVAGPELEVRAAVSPLAQYRAAFTDDVFDTTLFTVSADGPLPERIRIAALDAYDGEVFRGFEPGAADGAGAAAEFTRVPSLLEPDPGDPLVVRIEIGEYDEIWMPMAGSLTSVQFAGPRAAALADGFYYNAHQRAAVQIAGGSLQPGDAYELQVTVPVPREIASLTPPVGAPAAEILIPESLVRWVAAQDAGVSGAALAELIDRLRSRGYLSHALAVPDGDEPPRWVADLGDAGFQPSAAGHSLARVDELFQQLLTRAAEVEMAGAPSAGDAGDTLVAAIGDDEQFATATALIARHLGFPARVIVGVRLNDSTGLPACTDGVCRGGDLAAWAEVQDADGAWVPVDATPQHLIGINRDAEHLRDPQHATELRPKTAQEVVPPAPVQQDSLFPPEDDDHAAPDLTELWAILRVVALVILGAALLLSPFLAVVATKRWRRHTRRNGADPVSRIAGGWDEFVDTALDHGLNAPTALTRSELAAHFANGESAASTDGAALAARADRAVFANQRPDETDAAEFWRIVDSQRALLSAGAGSMQRLRAAVSLRSFARYLVPATTPRIRTTAWLHERRTQARPASQRQS